MAKFGHKRAHMAANLVSDPPVGEVTLLLQDEHFAKNRKGISLLLSELDLSQ